jgi:hypothetical protein
MFSGETALFIQSKPTKHRPFVVNFAVAAIVVLTIPIVGVVTGTRVETVAPIPDLPQRYLPGKSLPGDAACPKARIEVWYVNCEASHLGYKVEFIIQGSTMSIISSSIWTPNYTIGDLILAWGIPTGMDQDRHYINVFWGTRYALLLTRSFRPDSHVKMIVYTQKALRSSPWHGFASEMR